jgi:hypothetical protein
MVRILPVFQSEYWKYSDLAGADYHNIGLSVWRFLSDPSLGWLQSKKISDLANKDMDLLR